MKESITKFDLEAAFKALDEIDIPKSEKGIKANKPALTEIFSRKTGFDTLMEEYYDVSSTEELADAKEAREAEVAKAKLARIEKIVDLDADSPEDLLTSYVGKYIIQCPQCMTLFYKNPEDVEESEDDATTVNVNEICQHCGNESGYTLIGKVGEAEPEEEVPEESSEEVDTETSEETEEPSEETVENDSENAEEEDFDFDAELDELDFEIEDDETDEKKEESLTQSQPDNILVEQLTESTVNSYLDIQGFEHTITDTFEDEGCTGYNVVYSWNGQDIVEAEIWEENAPVYILENIYAPHFMQPYYSNFSEFAMDLEYKVNSTLQESKLTEANNLDVSAEDFEKLIKSSEFQRPISDTAARAMMQEFDDSAEEKTTQEESLEEGIFDKLKSRTDKAQWILEHALKNFNNLNPDAKGKITASPENRRFDRFVVVGFTDKFANGKNITMVPQPNNSNLVIDMERVISKKQYKDADKVAQGWSTLPGNGPAHIYLAKSNKDPNAAFLCTYFKGKLQQDQTDKYFEEIQKALKGAKMLSKGKAFSDFADDDDLGATDESLQICTSSKNILEDFINNIEDLQEDSLAEQIDHYLINKYENVANFRLLECVYKDKTLQVCGKTTLTSGTTVKTVFTFKEAYQNAAKRIVLEGLDDVNQMKVTLMGYAKKSNKTFITESFKAIK